MHTPAVVDSHDGQARRRPLALEIDLEAFGDRFEAEAFIEPVCVRALLAGVKLKLVAAGGASQADEVRHQLASDAAAASGGCDDDVLDDRPGLAVVGQVGHEQKIRAANDATVDRRDHQMPGRVGEDLIKDRLSVVAISRRSGASVAGELAEQGEQPVEICWQGAANEDGRHVAKSFRGVHPPAFVRGSATSTRLATEVLRVQRHDRVVGDAEQVGGVVAHRTVLGRQIREEQSHQLGEGSAPVVFHCAGGKDRSGIVAALVPALLGVSQDDIAADFALTEATRDWLIADWRRTHPGEASLWPGDPVRGDLGEALGQKAHGIDTRIETGLIVGLALDAEIVVAELVALRHPARRRDLPLMAQVDDRAHPERLKPLPILASQRRERIGAVKGAHRTGRPPAPQ